MVKFTHPSSVAQDSSVWILSVDLHYSSSSHAVAASHIAQPEGPTNRIYNYVLGDFGEKKKKKVKKRRLATDVSSGANLKKKKESKLILCKWSASASTSQLTDSQ